MNKDSQNIVNVTWRVLRSLPRRQKVQMAFLFLAMLVVAVLETVNLGVIAAYVSCVSDPTAFLNSKYMSVIIDNIPNLNIASEGVLIVSLSVIVVVVLILKNALQAVVIYCGSRFAARVEAYWGSLMLDGLLHMPYEWHQRKNSADLVLAIQWSVYLGRLFVDPLLRVMSDVVMIIVILVTLVVIKPLMSLMVLSILGGTAFFLFIRMRKYLSRVADRCKEYSQSLNRHVTKAIHGVKDVKVSGKENFFLQDYVDDAYPLARLMGWQQFLSRSPIWILEIVGFVMLTLSICIMFFTMKASPAEITATMALLAVTAYRVLPALNKVLTGLTKMHTAIPYIDNEFHYLDLIKEHSEKVEVPVNKANEEFEFVGEVCFKGVGFAYDGGGADALQGIDLVLKKGETLGVIGISGAGKSTFVDLLIGLLFPSEGEISIDGKILKDSLRRDWIQKVGYVAQFPYIYDGTLAENIAFGCRGDDIDRDRVVDCCEKAAMQDFVHELKNGIDTQIGERGARLSGGQQQRVIIARALYRNPAVIIFDEATSSLDTKSEKAIQKTMYTFKGNQTLIIVAHRLSTVEDCDKLLWLDKGRIRKVGIPAEVLSEYKAVMSDLEGGQ